MKFALLAILFSITFAAFGQVHSVQSGDTLIYEVVKPEQANNQPVVFVKRDRDLVLKLSFEDNGNRHYDFRNGKNYSVFDPAFARIMKHGEPIKEPYRFPLFIRDKRPEAGQKWDITFHSESNGNGDNIVNYKAVARDD